MPPIGPIVPVGEIVPVPARWLFPKILSCVSNSTIPSAKSNPPLGPPVFRTSKEISSTRIGAELRRFSLELRKSIAATTDEFCELFISFLEAILSALAVVPTR